MTAMPPASPAEPHSDTSGYMALTASALDQLDAQVVTADERYIHFSDSKYGLWESTSDPHGQLQPTNPLGTLFEASKTKTDLESDKCKDSSASPNLSYASISPHQSTASATPLLMADYTVDDTIYRHPETLDILISIVPTPDKGLAVFALRDLAPHTLVLSERPLLVLNDDGARADPLDALVHALAPPLQRAYRALHGFTTAPTTPRESRNRRVLYNNGFAIGRSTTAVFEVASRINHSCVPNARFRWDEAAGRMDYYVVRKVLEGEELCIDYGHTKGRLLKYYGFECACGGCTEWGSVTSSGAASERLLDGSRAEGRDAEVRLVQEDGLWRPVEVAEIAASTAVAAVEGEKAVRDRRDDGKSRTGQGGPTT